MPFEKDMFASEAPRIGSEFELITLTEEGFTNFCPTK